MVPEQTRSSSGLSLDRGRGGSLERGAGGERVGRTRCLGGLQNFVVIRAAHRDRRPSPWMRQEARRSPGHSAKGSPCHMGCLSGGLGV